MKLRNEGKINEIDGWKKCWRNEEEGRKGKYIDDGVMLKRDEK